MSENFSSHVVHFTLKGLVWESCARPGEFEDASVSLSLASDPSLLLSGDGMLHAFITK